MSRGDPDAAEARVGGERGRGRSGWTSEAPRSSACCWTPTAWSVTSCVATVRGPHGVVATAAPGRASRPRARGIAGRRAGRGRARPPRARRPADGTVSTRSTSASRSAPPLAALRRRAARGARGRRERPDGRGVGAAHTVDGERLDRRRRVHDLAFLALGTGLAAGLLLEGRLRRGSTGGAGEIGHLPLVPDGPPCKCGQRGCLEQYASGSALDAAGRAGTAVPRRRSCSPRPRPATRARSRSGTSSPAPSPPRCGSWC